MYQAILASKAQKSLKKFPKKDLKRIKKAIFQLENNPRRFGTIKLKHAPVASCRFRVGDYRILFDIDDKDKIIAVLDVRRRGEKTYQ
ncbi:type II toxin-antitoxin system RelE/ParE family toxin [Candidatus Microgenomates bacterium]|nr:type II toxin-antitoxin system RelE/ParE family toxin [Candidatus Microgenomates bacterium]